MTIKVLLADSNTSIHNVVELALADRDVELIAVGDGNAALDKAKEMRPQIVLIDIELPDLDGYNLCDRIKKEPSLGETKVVLLKPSFAPYDMDRAAMVKADGMLEKPFSAGALIHLIEAQTDETVSGVAPGGEPSAIPAAESVPGAEMPEPAGEDEAPGAEQEVAVEPADPLALDVSDDSSFADLDLDETLTTKEDEEGAGAGEPEAAGLETATGEAAEHEMEGAEAEPLEIGRKDIEPEPISIGGEGEETFIEPEPVEVVGESEAEAVEEPEPEPELIPVSEPDEEMVLEVEEEVTGLEIAAPGLAEAEGDDELVETITQRVLQRLRETGAAEAPATVSSEEGRILIEEIVKRLSDDVIREVAWEVVPDLAERMIRAALEDITKS